MKWDTVLQYLTVTDGTRTADESAVYFGEKRESTEIFRLIKMIDPNAFVSQSSVIGVYGEGFDEMKVKIKNISADSQKQ